MTDCIDRPLDEGTTGGGCFQTKPPKYIIFPHHPYSEEMFGIPQHSLFPMYF